MTTALHYMYVVLYYRHLLAKLNAVSLKLITKLRETTLGEVDYCALLSLRRILFHYNLQCMTSTDYEFVQVQISNPHMVNQSCIEKWLKVSPAVHVEKRGILNGQRVAQHAKKIATVVFLLWSKLCTITRDSTLQII